MRMLFRLITGGVIGLILFSVMAGLAFANCWDGNKGWWGFGCKIFSYPVDFGMQYIAFGHLEISIAAYVIVGALLGLIFAGKGSSRL